MALKKDIISKNGIKTSYHRINKVQFDTKETQIIIYSYADASYREKENMTKEKELLASLKNEFGILSASPEENLEAMNELQQRIDDLEKAITESQFENYYIDIKTITFPFDENRDLSFNSLYNELKFTDDFKDAENC